MDKEISKTGTPVSGHKEDKAVEPQLLALFRLLLKEPPLDHDFKTCKKCKEFGITEF